MSIIDPNNPERPDSRTLDAQSYLGVKNYLLRNLRKADRKERDARAIERVKGLYARK
jgi:hypothetical protein